MGNHRSCQQIGGTSLGEEYCEIRAISVHDHSLPSQRQRYSQFTLHVLLPYIAERLKVSVRPVRVARPNHTDNKRNRMVTFGNPNVLSSHTRYVDMLYDWLLYCDV
jgi:hypothetical protein